MKDIRPSINFNNHFNWRILRVPGLLSLMILSIFMLLLLMPTAHANESYRFDLLWPNLEQPWYFDNPNDVAIGPDGLVYVADSGFDRIQVFSADGEFIRSWGNEGAGDGEFSFPSGIAVSTSGEVYVVDTGNNRIQVFDTNGIFKRKWGGFGAEDGQFSSPNGIAVSTSGEVFVTDTGNNRIQVFDISGILKRKWGREGSGDGEFSNPNGIAISDSGSVYVVDGLISVSKSLTRMAYLRANGGTNLGIYSLHLLK